MNNDILNSYLNDSTRIDFLSFIISIITVAFLSFLIRLTYLKYSTSLSNKDEFSKIFIVLGLSTTLVITIVKSSLALSLGLVGALSIVRFRAAIKDPEELVYLFLIIAAGLGCGAGQIRITSIGIFAALTVIVIFYLFQKKNLDTNNAINAAFIFNKKIKTYELDDLIKKIEKNCSKIVFVSFSTTENQSTINLDIVPKNFKSLSEINKEINLKYKNIKIIFTKDNYLSL